MQQGRTKRRVALGDLPLLPGQTRALTRLGITDPAALFRHPRIQEALAELCTRPDDRDQEELARLPLAEFLAGPDLENLAAAGCRTFGQLLALPPEELSRHARLEWHPEKLLAAIGWEEGSRRAEWLDLPIEKAGAPPRALKACRRLKVRTIRDFLALSREDFTALPKVGEKTYLALQQGVDRFLESRRTGAGPAGLERPLVEVVENRRARKAFRELGLKTVGDFLATPKEELLRLKNFGERTWHQVSARIGGLVALDNPLPPALPPALLQFRLDLLPLPRRVQEALDRSGLATVADLCGMARSALLARRNFGEDSWQALVDCLDQAVRQGLDSLAVPSPESVTGLAELKEMLLARIDSPRDRRLFSARTGLHWHGPARLQDVGRELGISKERVRQVGNRLREELGRRFSGLLVRFQAELEGHIAAGGGVLPEPEMARLPMAAGPQDRASRIGAIKGLALFFFGDRLTLLSLGGLTNLPRDRVKSLRRALARRIDREAQVQTPTLVEEALDAAGLDRESYAGLARHLLVKGHGLVLRPLAEGGQVLAPRTDPHQEELVRIVADARGGISVGDLQLLYSSRCRPVSRNWVRRALCNGELFHRCGPDLYCLREDLPLAPEEAARLEREAVDRLRIEERPLEAAALAPSGEDPYLVAACLAESERLRNLGRGLFTLMEAGTGRPSWVEERVCSFLRGLDGPAVLADIKAGTVTPAGPSGQVVTTLVMTSRRIALYAPGTYGLEENHPLSGAARREAVAAVRERLEQGGGFGLLDRILAHLQAAGTVAEGTGKSMLRDACERAGGFRFFGRAFCELEGSGISADLMGKMRDFLHRARGPVNLNFILAEHPELAEFEDALEDILEADPMVRKLGDDSFGILK